MRLRSIIGRLRRYTGQGSFNSYVLPTIVKTSARMKGARVR
nr:hypothetical protein [Saccharolobus solfataricus]